MLILLILFQQPDLLHLLSKKKRNYEEFIVSLLFLRILVVEFLKKSDSYFAKLEVSASYNIYDILSLSFETLLPMLEKSKIYAFKVSAVPLRSFRDIGFSGKEP